MTLDHYLSLDGNSVAGLAEKAGTSVPSIHRIRKGTQQPSAAMIRAIVEATGGAVTADDLVFGARQEAP